MAIIAIARERGALGKLVASELARTLNYRFIDKRTVEERLEGLGLDQRQFNAYDEKNLGCSQPCPLSWKTISAA